MVCVATGERTIARGDAGDEIGLAVDPPGSRGGGAQHESCERPERARH